MKQVPTCYEKMAKGGINDIRAGIIKFFLEKASLNPEFGDNSRSLYSGR